MGKLHSLRRAIEREPKAWKGFAGRPTGAWFDRREQRWKPQYWPWSSSSYVAFVRHVLAGIGNADDMGQDGDGV